MNIPKFRGAQKVVCLALVMGCASFTALGLKAQETSAEARPPKLNFTEHGMDTQTQFGILISEDMERVRQQNVCLVEVAVAMVNHGDVHMNSWK